jgi:nitrite reductase/ring-hydroxylating ferredoxin subunit/uncharacterized membrane protein
VTPAPTDPIATQLQNQQWMEPLEKGLKQTLDAAFAPDAARGKPVANALHGVWLGHPLHPALTDIPLGAWTVTLVLDLIEDITGDTKYRAGADAALTIGIIGAAAAAIPGLTDWKDIDQDARRTGLLHGLLNTTALSLYAGSSLQRNNRNRAAGRLLSYVAFGISIGAAWLGGNLSFTNRVGAARVPSQDPPHDFTPVLAMSELEDNQPRHVEANGYPVVLVKRNDQVFALTDLCTHAGGPLSEGTVENDCIRCPWHGSLFSMKTGEVVEGPSVHCVRAFETRIRDGQIEIKS